MLRSRLSSRPRSRGLRIAGVVAALGLIMPAAGAVAPEIPSRAAKVPLGNYIVMLKPSVGDPAAVAQEQTNRPGASVGSVFRTLKGYAGTFRKGDIEAVRRDPRTELIARDDTVRTMDVVAQSPAPFGLDRVDQTSRPLDNSFAANNDGDTVHVYVLDTGIRATHSELAGRVEAASGASFINDGRGTTDCNGHGTHVSGIVGGSTYGVAKAVKLVPVRTLNCSGSASTSTVIAAIDWVTKNAQRPAVANMSLGGSSNSALDLAVQNAVNSGVPFSIAAGNGNFLGWAANACNTSPARVRTPGAMTIGATDANDNKASFSNYGDCVDWFAPGVNIKSSWYTNDSATQTLSGTSMAAPYTAGVAALYLDAHPGATPAQVETALLNLSQLSAVAGNSRTSALHSHIVFTGRGTPDML